MQTTYPHSASQTQKEQETSENLYLWMGYDTRVRGEITKCHYSGHYTLGT